MNTSNERKLWLVLLVLIAFFLPAMTLAPLPGYSAPPSDEATAQTSDKPSEPDKAPSIATSLPAAIADSGGARSSLQAAGVTYSLTYIGDALGNVSGGTRRRGTYVGRLDFQFDADLDKLAGLKGLSFHSNFYQIHGRGLSTCCLSNLFTSSGIEATPSTRLFELYLEQKLFDDKLSLRIGQLSADAEFVVSQYASLFVNSSFGFPAITAANLPSGGPAYPLATPGVRVRLDPTEAFSIAVGLYDGDSAGKARALDSADPQRRNPSGLAFRLSDPPLLFVETAYKRNQEKDATGLPGTFKLGGWRHFGRFDDQRLDAEGLSLADPASSGAAGRLRGNGGLYAIVDQLLYRVEGTTDRGLGLFTRISGSPADRNPVAFYVDGGLTFKGLFDSRPDDTIGIAAGYAGISGRAHDLDRDVRSFGAPGGVYPIRSGEGLLEATYQLQIVPGFTLQPDFQYVIRPGGGISNPRDPSGARIRNAAVFGLRATVRY